MYTSIVNKVILPLSDKFLGLSINENLKFYRYAQWLTKEELRTIQKKQPEKNIGTLLLPHFIPYYKEILKNKINLENDPYEVIKKLPILKQKVDKG